MKASDTTWRLVGNSVMISPFAIGSLPADLLKPLAKLLGLPQEGLALNTDQWDGYDPQIQGYNFAFWTDVHQA